MRIAVLISNWLSSATLKLNIRSDSRGQPSDKASLFLVIEGAERSTNACKGNQQDVLTLLGRFNLDEEMTVIGKNRRLLIDPI
jgi:hypothetical protein